ncbi:MAG: geranylgeranyl reductase family protein [Candidatus Methanomethylophilaceae archaeon]|nr:geranylgeranyl reductase family protein [Candidatus Methanomethylophilaceae archaeon]
MDRLDTDILVVGSGPAGSTAARFAAAAGADVTILERRSVVGSPVRCGEFMPSMEEISAMFPQAEDLSDIFDMPASLCCRQLEAIRLVTPKGKAYDIPFQGYSTERDRFDQHLASLAVDNGARLMTDTVFHGIEGGVAKTSAGDISYKVIIGADGPGSRTAQSLGLPANHQPYPAVTAQAKGEFDPVLVMYFGGIAPGAYSWIIPKAGSANVGIGFSPRFAQDTPRSYFDTFVQREGLEITSRMTGKYVPSCGPVESTVRDNGLIVGDAAGHVMSVNGGGVPLAILAGRIAGHISAENISAQRPLWDYELEWRRLMWKPLHTAHGTKRMADFFAFGSDLRTDVCMRILGKRRMAKMLRCRPIFP